jgi:CheY-like chemotaxis protein
MRAVKILVVEDNRAIFELVKETLVLYFRRDGYDCEVVHAPNGVSGLQQVWQIQPDVILLDIQMPLLDGYGVLEALRAEGNATPVVIMTANRGEEERQKGFKMGCNAYIKKPLMLPLLYSHIQEQLKEGVI